MIPYLAILALISALAVLFYALPDQKKAKKAFSCISVLVLALFMGLRGQDVGIDTPSYSDYFCRIADSSDPAHFMNIVTAAPIYSLFNKLLGIFSHDPQILLICVAFITCISVMVFINSFSENVYLSTFFFIALYFYINCFNGMRQGLAISLCLLSFALMFKKHGRWSLVVLIMAAGVHLTSLVMAPFIFLCRRKWSITSTQKWCIAVLCLSVLLFFFLPYILDWFIALVPRYSHYSDLLFSERYKTAGRNILRTFFYLGILILFFWGINKNRGIKEDERQRDIKLLIPVMFGVAIALVFYDNYLLCERIAAFLLVLMIVVIPNTMKYLTSIRALYSIISCGAGIVLYIVLLNGNYAGVIPYSFFWS